MTRKEALTHLGQLVQWNNMDARIDQTKTIIERVGKHCIATISYSVQYRPERFVTYKHVSELWGT